jgi:hypothetical protein
MGVIGSEERGAMGGAFARRRAKDVVADEGLEQALLQTKA